MNNNNCMKEIPIPRKKNLKTWFYFSKDANVRLLEIYWLILETMFIAETFNTKYIKIIVKAWVSDHLCISINKQDHLFHADNEACYNFLQICNQVSILYIIFKCGKNLEKSAKF